MFYNMVMNKHCPIKDPKTLMYKYTLKEITELLEVIEIHETIELACALDEKEKIDKLTNRA